MVSLMAFAIYVSRSNRFRNESWLVPTTQCRSKNTAYLGSGRDVDLSIVCYKNGEQASRIQGDVYLGYANLAECGRVDEPQSSEPSLWG